MNYSCKATAQPFFEIPERYFPKVEGWVEMTHCVLRRLNMFGLKIQLEYLKQNKFYYLPNKLQYEFCAVEKHIVIL